MKSLPLKEGVNDYEFYCGEGCSFADHLSAVIVLKRPWKILSESQWSLTICMATQGATLVSVVKPFHLLLRRTAQREGIVSISSQAPTPLAAKEGKRVHDSSYLKVPTVESLLSSFPGPKPSINQSALNKSINSSLAIIC